MFLLLMQLTLYRFSLHISGNLVTLLHCPNVLLSPSPTHTQTANLNMSDHKCDLKTHRNYLTTPKYKDDIITHLQGLWAAQFY